MVPRSIAWTRKRVRGAAKKRDMANQLSTTIALLGLLAVAAVTAQADDEAIARAVLPLPESMRG